MAIIAAAVIILIGVTSICFLSRVVRARNSVDGAWREIEEEFDNRRSLAEDLMGLIKHHADSDMGLLASADCTDDAANGTKDEEYAESALSRQLQRMMAIVEANQDMKTDRHIKEIEQEISDAEEKIRAARIRYNSIVRYYNQQISAFPGRLLAGRYGFDKETSFNMEFATEHKLQSIASEQSTE